MQVHIDIEVCKGCGLCLHYCPKGVLRLSEQHNKKGYHFAELADLDACTGCRLCEIGCPDLAIYVEGVPVSR